MTAIESLAEFIQSKFPNDAAREERIRMHVADTVCAVLAGEDCPGSPLVRAAAAARSTEMDDIHLGACITPGAAVVPAALHLNCFENFFGCVLAGYEVMIRVGYAIDGPHVLNKGVWPSYFAAPLGSCAVACRALKLDAGQTAGALATALAFCSPVAVPMNVPRTSRWFAFGTAVEAGVSAALAARDGTGGPADLLERYGFRICGVRISRKQLLRRGFLFDETGMKPYSTARQALAAIEGVRQLGSGRISEVVVRVPAEQVRIVTGVQHQIAKSVRVERAADLDKHYPDAWPARVTARSGGALRSITVLYPRGDYRNPLGWEEILNKAPKELRDHLTDFGLGGLRRLTALTFSRKSRRSTM